MQLTKKTTIQQFYDEGYLDGPDGLQSRDLDDFFLGRSRYGYNPEPLELNIIKALTLEGIVERLKTMTVQLCCFEHEKPVGEGRFDFHKCSRRMSNLGCGHLGLPLLPLKIAIVVLHKQGFITKDKQNLLKHLLSSNESSLYYADTEAWKQYCRISEGTLEVEDPIRQVRETQYSTGNLIKKVRDEVLRHVDILLKTLV